MNKTKLKQTIPFLFSFFSCFLMRIFLINLPNVEPINSFLFLNAKRFDLLSLFLFSAFNIFLFDVITFKLGIWTLITALTYSFISLGTYFIKNNKVNLITYTIVSTLIYDFITGILMSWLIFNQNLMQVIVGQIPFTAIHVMGNLVLTLAFAQVLELFVVVKLKLLKNSKISC